MSKIWFLLIAVTLLWAVGFCQAQDSIREKLAKLDASLEDQQAASNSTFTERFDSNAFVERFGLLEAQVKTMEETGRSRDSRISGLEEQQKKLQESNAACDLQITGLERKFLAIENRINARQADEVLNEKIAALESRLQLLEAQPASSQVEVDSEQSTALTYLEADNPVTSETESRSEDYFFIAAASAVDPDDVWSRDTLTNGFFGLNDGLADSGIEIALGMTNIYQANVHGGNSTHNKQGRDTGSYNLEIGVDLEPLLNIAGGSLLVHTEGSWSRSDADSTSIGSYFGANGDAAGRRAMDITELWYEQALFGETLSVRLGKMDITGGFECRGCPVSFDGSAYANDETAQFFNSALVNNPTVPFPDVGLGAVIYWNPIEWWYSSVGAIDAQADGRETGFRTTFHDEDYFFYVFETGVAPEFNSLPGAYRVGVWNDPQPKANSDAMKNYRDDVGVYVSCDQMLYKENDDSEDGQGFGVFARWGYANGQRNDMKSFWSTGLQYQGLVEGRDDDVLGVGLAHGTFSDSADTTYMDDYESVLEAYYNIYASPWLSISPMVQYIANPGGTGMTKDAVVLGLRAQSAF